MFIGKQSHSGLRCEFNSLEKQIKQMITAFLFKRVTYQRDRSLRGGRHGGNRAS